MTFSYLNKEWEDIYSMDNGCFFTFYEGNPNEEAFNQLFLEAEVHGVTYCIFASQTEVEGYEFINLGQMLSIVIPIGGVVHGLD